MVGFGNAVRRVAIGVTIGLAIVIGLALLAENLSAPGAGSGSAPIAAHAADNADKLADIAAIKPAVDQIKRSSDWMEIEITEAQRREYSLTLWYWEASAPSRTQAELDTKTIARAVLAALVRQARDPAAEHISLMVHAMRHMRGETGKALVNWFGYAAYNYNNDGLDYKECTRGSWTGC